MAFRAQRRVSFFPAPPRRLPLPGIGLLLTLLLGLCQCAPGPHASRQEGTALAMRWAPVDSLNARLPESIRLFAGRSEPGPLRAWYVRIAGPGTQTPLRIAASDDPGDGRETVSSFARDLDACIAVNGGYFSMDETPSRAAGLLVTEDTLRVPSTRRATGSKALPLRRAAFALMHDGRVDIAWASSRSDTVYAWTSPDRDGAATPWDVEAALGAGPMLVHGDSLRVTIHPEGFSDFLRKAHPRTAVGRTAEGALILMVIDGRQPASRGATLPETARLMRDVGAMEALNLDGGGSTALVVRGVLVNRPEGNTRQREVRTALVAFCE